MYLYDYNFCAIGKRELVVALDSPRRSKVPLVLAAGSEEGFNYLHENNAGHTIQRFLPENWRDIIFPERLLSHDQKFQIPSIVHVTAGELREVWAGFTPVNCERGLREAGAGVRDQFCGHFDGGKTNQDLSTQEQFVSMLEILTSIAGRRSGNLKTPYMGDHINQIRPAMAACFVPQVTEDLQGVSTRETEDARKKP
ncbi:hypothetical protein RRG08_043435 [Elysia crispata]|uniref:Uncharacterized protein n=1 Tax=Elysia crispata TaxID=231223 RepID=A0AAE0YKQ7_9GAST|nr:hypothetical protein RRG08_043435 [Elysia crispata]